jgi:hypothetical protein
MPSYYAILSKPDSKSNKLQDTHNTMPKSHIFNTLNKTAEFRNINSAFTSVNKKNQIPFSSVNLNIR